ncbi:hypothetical protein GUJ93_ZPchr0005g14693 [Zizania palustris]|uniref:Uncharacterized protein n=1 Tax=Zizania palustris TaxID=103762 RepID=A0A8J5VQZ4_ZIZPA|nr:hypothetical protein GUJ93_ZPchr0005g14693 [Zizania palustris]KAG8068057.1 hypothetical protein GUJ93_ZPchr0005g14693 [Zizania palustris]KAG8068058.1 hypothetical protein GUJ93_ZPchr0005g14693 [Zizania palustris]
MCRWCSWRWASTSAPHTAVLVLRAPSRRTPRRFRGDGGGRRRGAAGGDLRPVAAVLRLVPSQVPALPRGQSQVEMELRVLQALEFYPPSMLKGIHRHFVVLYALMEYLEKSLIRQFSADEVLQLLHRFFNLEKLVI